MSPRYIGLIALLFIGCSTSVPNDPGETPAEAPSSLPIHVLPTGECGAMAFSPDNRFLAISVNGGLQIWDLNREAKVVEAAIHAGLVAWSPDGTRLVTLDRAGLLGEPAWLHLWEFRDESRLEPLATVTIPKQVRFQVRGPLHVAFVPDGRVLAPGDLGVTGYSREGPAAERLNLIAKGAVAVGAAGTEFVSVSPAGAIRRHDATGKLVAEPSSPCVMFASEAAFAPAAKRIALTDGHCLCVKDAATGRQLFRTVLPPSCYDLAYSPDGRVLAVTQWRQGILLLNGATGSIRGWWKGAQHAVFSPDGKLVAWEEGDKVVVRSTAGAITGAAEPPPESPLGPLRLELVSKQGKYVLDPKTFSLDDAVIGRQAAQVVDMEVLIRNVASHDVLIDPDGDASAFLHGDGAMNASWVAQDFLVPHDITPLRLAPGGVHRIAVTELQGSCARSYWASPGKYQVYASYSTRLHSRDDGKESESITLRSLPIDVTVVAP